MILAPFQGVAFKLDGSGLVVPAPSASIEVREKATGNLASIFSDEAGSSPITNPSAFADSDGNFLFYAAGRERGYTVEVTDGAFSYELHASLGTAGQFDATTFAGGTLLALADLAALRALIKSPRPLFTYSGADVPNAGGSLEDGITYNMPADTLGTGERLRIKAWGIFANNANAKEVRLYFGSVSLIGIAIPTGDSGFFSFEAFVVSKGAASQKYLAEFIFSNSTVAAPDTLSQDITEDETAQITIKTATDATAAADVTWRGLIVELWPAP